MSTKKYAVMSNAGWVVRNVSFDEAKKRALQVEDRTVYVRIHDTHDELRAMTDPDKPKIEVVPSIGAEHAHHLRCGRYLWNAGGGWVLTWPTHYPTRQGAEEIAATLRTVNCYPQGDEA